jgi:cellulose synthase/poly-beta-1,6-N-acetylglucosamine synthase-like glycosyltransferase
MMAALLWFALGLTVYIFAFPLVLSALVQLRRQPHPAPLADPPSEDAATRPLVSVLVPLCGRADMLATKLINLAATTYPRHRLEVLLILDGPVAGLRAALKKFRAAVENPLQLEIVQCKRVGKNKALNEGVGQAVGDILVFTDADALLAPDAITRLVGAILPEDIGGGCGRHRIRTSRGAQSIYWDMEARIKAAEMRLLGSVSASYGTLMAVKRQRFKSIPPGVTDDLFLALSVITQGLRFIYAGEAVAELEKPSRDPFDEIRRRRRIVTQSLYCLSLCRTLLHPGRWGWFAVCLWSHKVLRRLAPLLFIFCFLASLALGMQGSLGGGIIFLAMTAGLALSAFALALLICFQRLHRLLRPAAYFLAGNIGILIGLIDFMRGRRVVMW